MQQQHNPEATPQPAHRKGFEQVLRASVAANGQCTLSRHAAAPRLSKHQLRPNAPPPLAHRDEQRERGPRPVLCRRAEVDAWTRPLDRSKPRQPRGLRQGTGGRAVARHGPQHDSPTEGTEPFRGARATTDHAGPSPDALEEPSLTDPVRNQESSEGLKGKGRQVTDVAPRTATGAYRYSRAHQSTHARGSIS